MFILHTSNRTENLLRHLAKVIEEQPLSTPFSTELFLIQSQGMERWISQQLASHFGVWGNYQFYFPANFFSEISTTFVKDDWGTNYQREQMVWIFDQLLRGIESNDSETFQVINHYLASGSKAIKRFQFAEQLARIYDQYQMMRPDWLSAWSKGELKGIDNSERWQSELWQQVIRRFGHSHRGEIWERTIAAIGQVDPSILAEQLPQRISIFGLNTMPPLMLRLLQGLSQHIDIHLFLLTPTREYWGDSGSRRSTIQLALDLEGSDLEMDHRLLQSLGEQAREFQRMLLDGVNFSHEFSSYEESEGSSISTLNRLQNDLLGNSSRREAVERDGSILIHSCHSPLREVEVIHDQLLALLDEDKALELRDIVVMSPDIQNYTAHIKVIFNDIPHAIADRTLRDDSELLDNTIQFLKVARGRFGWQEVLDLLERPAIFPAFGLHEDELQLIRHWVAEVNIRWGLSAEHRQELDLPQFEAFSWQAGLDRLMMGYAVGEHGEPVDGILPYADLEGNSAEPLGGLYRFLTILAQAQRELSEAVPLQQWAERIERYSAHIFDQTRDPSGADERGLGHLHQLIEQLSGELTAVHEDKVELEVIERWMQGTLSERKSANGFLRGQLTFCSMLPMRSIPFKTIVLMGMNEGAYPRIIQPYTFDLMGRDHRLGDRSARNDDRAQFLETLISARERLLISYVGQSIQDNSEIAPSAVVGELIDTLELDYQQRDMVTKHPLQPFNQQYYAYRDVGKEREQGCGSVAYRDVGKEREQGCGSVAYRDVGKEREHDCKDAEGRATHGVVAGGRDSFDASSKLFSYSQKGLKTARLLAGERVGERPWWQGELEREMAPVVELQSLFRFYKDPQRYFLEHSLGIRLEESGAEMDERERFEIDALESYLTNQHIVELLMDSERDFDRAQLMGEGWWIGAAGELELERRVRALEPFVETIHSLELGERIEAVDIDLQVGALRIVGQLSHNYKQGALIYRYTRMKGGDLINGWIYHQLINRIIPVTTHLVTQDRHIQFLPEMVNPEELERWLDIYIDGQQQPSVLLVEPALAYLQQLNIKSKKSPIDAAKTRLHNQLDGDFNPQMKLLYRGVVDVDALITEPFQQVCDELLVPMWSGLS